MQTTPVLKADYNAGSPKLKQIIMGVESDLGGGGSQVGTKQGCKVSTNGTTLSVDKCILEVDGDLISTTIATTTTWGGSNPAETASTKYYLYAQKSVTLDLLISTTAPDALGYDGTSRVLAWFYNNADSDIDALSITPWYIDGFKHVTSVWSTPTTITIDAVTTAPGKGTTSRDRIIYRRDGRDMIIHFDYAQTTGGSAGSGSYLFKLPSGYLINYNIIDITTDVDSAGAGTNVVGNGGLFASSGSRSVISVKAYNTTSLTIGKDATNSDIGSNAVSLGNSAFRVSFLCKSAYNRLGVKYENYNIV